MFKKRVSPFFCIALALVVSIVTAVGVSSYASVREQERLNELRLETDGYAGLNQYISLIGDDADEVAKLSTLIDLIQTNSIREYDSDSAWDLIYKALVLSLGDEYSSYLTAEEYTAMLDDSKGNFVGIGVHATYDVDEVGIYIFGVIPDSPAEKAGIQNGDVIVGVEAISATEDNYYTMLDTIIGESGSEVKLRIRRDGEEFDVSITRASVASENVLYEKLDGNIAYIRILSFNDETVSEQFETVLKRAENDGCESYVFDVRNNTGGYLDEICAILDMLLPEGPIIHTVFANGETDTVNSDAECLEAPMVVLCNDMTASAAELFTAALRDYELAETVGETTFGKGTMQTIRPLGDGTALKLSYAYYNPPLNVSYDGVGIAPDYEVALDEKWETRYYKMPKDEDVQLQKAVSLLASPKTAQ